MNQEQIRRRHRCARLTSGLTVCAAIAALLLPSVAPAQGPGLSGKQVVESTCAQCHTNGQEGAPRIGDAAAWKARAAQGLTGLSQHALLGLRKMPAHGGNPGLSDAEIKRAITYMVNRSGGNWIEPLEGGGTRQRSGEQIVGMQCAKCHENGSDGAPRIGDLTAWSQRFARGTEALIRSAINGHGGMPARGGLADLTDAEMRIAALYMFLKDVYPVDSPPLRQTPPAKVEDRNHRSVGGMEVYLGVIAAEVLRARAPGGREVPRGKAVYHVNVSLFERDSGAEIKDAKVEMSIEDPVSGVQTKKLDALPFDQATSYGNYFNMPEKLGYKLVATITRPGQSEPVQARFEYRPD